HIIATLGAIRTKTLVESRMPVYLSAAVFYYRGAADPNETILSVLIAVVVRKYFDRPNEPVSGQCPLRRSCRERVLERLGRGPCQYPLPGPEGGRDLTG